MFLSILENAELGRVIVIFGLGFLIWVVVVKTHAALLLALDSNLVILLLFGNLLIFLHHIFELGNYFLRGLSLRKSFEHFFCLSSLFCLVLQPLSYFRIFFLLFLQSLSFLGKSLFLFRLFTCIFHFLLLIFRHLFKRCFWLILFYSLELFETLWFGTFQFLDLLEFLNWCDDLLRLLFFNFLNWFCYNHSLGFGRWHSLSLLCLLWIFFRFRGFLFFQYLNWLSSYFFRLSLFYSLLRLLLGDNDWFLFNYFRLFGNDLFWLFNSLDGWIRFIINHSLESGLRCFFLGCFHSFKIVLDNRFILSAFNRLILLLLSLQIIVVSIVVFIDDCSLRELELVTVKSTRTNDILRKHVREWLLISHLLFH